MHGPLAGGAEATADFSRGAGGLKGAFLGKEVRKTCSSALLMFAGVGMCTGRL